MHISTLSKNRMEYVLVCIIQPLISNMGHIGADIRVLCSYQIVNVLTAASTCEWLHSNFNTHTHCMKSKLHCKEKQLNECEWVN